VCFVCSGTALEDEVSDRADDHCSPRGSRAIVRVPLKNRWRVNAIILRARYSHLENCCCCCLFCWQHTNFPFCKSCPMLLVQLAQSKCQQWISVFIIPGYWVGRIEFRNGVFWDLTPCGVCKNRRFGGT
jgi:hypothetical protein